MGAFLLDGNVLLTVCQHQSQVVYPGNDSKIDVLHMFWNAAAFSRDH